MNKNHNNMIKDTILKLDSIEVNEFDHGVGKTANFIEYAASKYNLDIVKNQEKKIIKLFYEKVEIAKMSGLRPSSTSDVAYKLCKDKFKLENHLTKMNLNTLESKLFYQQDFNKALSFIQKNTNDSFVVKPLNMAGGDGIHLDVRENTFNIAWDNCIKVQLHAGVKKPSCIIQPFIRGFDVRISIIEGKFSGAILRVPAHVIGNGSSNIKELIDEKNKIRREIGYFRNKLIPMDNTIKEYIRLFEMTFDTIPEKNEVVMLTDMSNLTFGGESIDITDIISKDIMNLAINAAASIPGLYSTGIDIMTHDFRNGIGYIIEMNTSANLTMHHIPLKGKRRYPFFTYARANLIKHKALNNIRLTINEEKFWAEVQKFLYLKDKYATKYFKINEL